MEILEDMEENEQKGEELVVVVNDVDIQEEKAGEAAEDSVKQGTDGKRSNRSCKNPTV